MVRNAPFGVNTYQARASLRVIRILILVFGATLPFFAGLPAELLSSSGSPAWRAFHTPSGFLYLAGTSFPIWFFILIGTLFYRSPMSAIVSACVGFAVPVLGYVSLGFATDAQTPIAYLSLPVYSIPGVALGWGIGMWIDRKRGRS